MAEDACSHDFQFICLFIPLKGKKREDEHLISFPRPPNRPANERMGRKLVRGCTGIYGGEGVLVGAEQKCEIGKLTAHAAFYFT